LKSNAKMENAVIKYQISATEKKRPDSSIGPNGT
jgi:hypothetical protein